ncbi:unnamed protein product, partial [Prorocentrum cordatum]
AGGHKILLEFLDETLMDQPVPEAAKYLKECLFTLRRRNNEGMKAYAQRSRTTTEIKLVKKMRPEEKTESVTLESTREREGPEGDDEGAEDDGSWKDENDGYWKGSWWYGSSWWSSSPTGSAGWTWPQGTTSLKAHKKVTLKEKATDALCSLMARFDLGDDDADIKALKGVATEARETLIPSVMAGWLLLQRAGLNAQERAEVLSSAKNSLNLKNIEAALRGQWADVDLKEAPGDYDPEDDYEACVEFDWDEDELDFEGLDEEERAEAEEALAVIAGAKKDVKNQKRTLAQARAVVKDIKQSRGFFQKGRGKGKKGGNGRGGPCFICSGPRRKADCPKNPEHRNREQPRGRASQVRALALSFASWEADDGELEENDLEMAYAEFEVEHALAGLADETEGCMVLDSGATKTFGSIVALEKIIEKQQQAGIDTSNVKVDVTDRPKFGFANGDAEQCSCGANLPLQANGGHYVPLLGSVDFLKRAGAIIDFETGVACFDKITKNKVAKLKRISTGHLCIDMTKDLYDAKVNHTDREDFKQKLEDLQQALGTARVAAADPAATADVPIDRNKHRNIKKDKDLDGGSGHRRGSGDRQRRQTDPERWGKRTIGEWMTLDRRDLRLDWDRAESADEKDDRYTGKPCYGEHDPTRPLARHANGYKVSYKFVRCELVMLYIPKHGATGRCRQRGGDDVITFGIDVEYHREEINLKDYSWVLEQVAEAGMATDLYVKQLIEFCTEEGSQLGKVAEEREDAEIIRITRKDADLSTEHGLELAKNLAVKNPGADIWGSLPCTAVSALHSGYIGRQDGQHWKKLEARKKNLKKIVNHFVEVSRIVKDNGGDVHFERPRNCHGWKYFPELTEFFGELGMEKVNFDGCQVGVVNTKGEPIYKPWTLWTSRKELATALSGKRCPDPQGHGHAECCGKDATLSGKYPARMARLIWRNIVEPPKLMGLIEELRQEEALANDNKEMFDHERELELTSDEQLQWNDLPALKENELMKAARRLHRNTGHRPQRVMIRILRRRGASATTIAAAKQIKCSSCIENQMPRPRPAAVLEPARDLWQVVGIDVKEIVGNDPVKRKYLVIVDEASKLTLAVKIFSVPAQESRNCTAKELLDAFRGHWSDRHGMPSVLRLDPEGAFVSHEFYDRIAGEGVQVDPCATQAHWQNGIAGRAIKTVFECAKAMHRDHETDLEAAVHAAVEAHNAVERVDGYRPSQWAFGRDKNWSGTLKKEDHLDVVECTNQSYMENLSRRVLESKIIGERILKQQQVISVDKEDVPMNEETYTPETTARAPEYGDKEDHWEEGFRSKPEKTTMERITVIRYEDCSEETVKDDSWNVHGKSTRSMGRGWTGRTYLFPIADKPEDMKVDQNDKEGIHEKAKKTVVEQVPETHETLRKTSRRRMTS